VIEDVTTTGGSTMKAVETVQEAGAEVALVFTMVDRQEGAAEAFAAASLRFQALFSAEEFSRR
jgi:orotate phosphoribosyltransferase